jgi:hypothetical protein
LDSGVSLIEDWAKMELVYTGAEALSSSAGVLARQGVELTTLNLISDFTGVPVVTRGGLELTRHTATESLAGRYALRGGRRAATMDELDALYRSGVPKPNVPRGTMEITRPDLPKVKDGRRPLNTNALHSSSGYYCNCSERNSADRVMVKLVDSSCSSALLSVTRAQSRKVLVQPSIDQRLDNGGASELRVRNWPRHHSQFAEWQSISGWRRPHLDDRRRYRHRGGYYFADRGCARCCHLRRRPVPVRSSSSTLPR